jgi:LCP family protein required for cell wall assembly
MRLVILSILSLFLAVAGWFGFQAYHVYRAIRSTTGVVVPRTTAEPTVTIPPLDSNQRINFLVLGSDNDLKREEARPLTQSMIVVTVDPKHDKVTLLSIPRDFWVPIRGHGMAKIDLASKYGGVALARETVENLFHIPIDYYAWVGLHGFIRVIDTFGGISLDVTHPILDDTYPNDLSSGNPYAYRRIFVPPGWQHMTGTQALEYVRSRHGDRISDFGRSARQQQVLLRLRQKINAMDVITHLPALADDLSSSVRTDLTLTKLYQLAQLSRQIPRRNVTQVVLQAPVYSSYGWAEGQSVLFPNWPRIRPLLRQIFAPLSTAPTARPRLKAQPTATPRPQPTTRPTTARPTTTPAPSARATASPTPRSTPATPQLSHLPGTLLFVGNDGNMYELTRDEHVKQVFWGGDGAMPSLSPDGRTIAFIRFTNGLHRFDKYASDIWLLDLPTGRQHVITHDENSVAANNLWAAWPSWSPDGKQLLFSWDAAKLSQPPSDARSADLAIYSLPLNRSQSTQLSVPAQGSGGDTDAAWRPGHAQISYVKWNYDNNNQPYSQLMVKDMRSAALWALTSVDGHILQPQWNRQGNEVVFVRGVDATSGNDQVVLARVVDTSNGPQLGAERVLASGEVAQPAFTPNGRWISWLHVSGDGFALSTARTSGGPSIEIGAVGSAIDARSRPVWLP